MPEKSPEYEYWTPELSDAQRKAYLDDQPFILLYGERYSGKSWVGMNKGVRHCYLHSGAVVLLITLTRIGQAAGGIWETLTTNDTVDGEPDIPAGVLKRWQKGIDLEYGEPRTDRSGAMLIDIRAQDGGISKIIYKSLLIGAHIPDRIKDMAPSMFIVDELMNTYDRNYFTKPVQQLFRRPQVKARFHQYIGIGNPPEAGKKHWTYKQWFVDPVSDSGVRDKKYSVHHIPINQNKWVQDYDLYKEALMAEVRNDPTAFNRLIKGEWVERISGTSIFEFYFDENIHIVGTPNKYGLLPIPGFPVILGYDPGDVNNANAFLQRVPLKNGQFLWRQFDEISSIDKKKDYKVLVREIMNKMLFWNKHPAHDGQLHDFSYIHISDAQAVNAFNVVGSYLYRQYYEESKRLIESEPKYAKLKPIRLRAPKKFPGSKRDRVRLMQEMLAAELYICSANCVATRRMLGFLKKDTDKMGNEDDLMPKKTQDGTIHMFDAVTYPMMLLEVMKSRRPKNKKIGFTSSSAA